MSQYRVTGMSCAACAVRVERAVSEVAGVQSCSVSLLTNSLQVYGSSSSEMIIAAVTKAGYGCTISTDDWQPLLESLDAPIIRKRLGLSLSFLIAILYMSLGHQMFGWPLPGFLDHRPVHSTLVKMVLTIAIIIVNRKFFINGFRGFIKGAANMDTLVAMGAGAAFAWSVGIFVLMLRLSVAHNTENLPAIADLNRELYFESAAMILTLITVGKLLEALAKGRTTDALRRLISLAPQTATILREGQEVTVPFRDVQKGDIFVLHPGDRVPVDGTVLRGASAIDESTLTGESMPIDKKEGDIVSAATHNLSGYMECEAVRVGPDTTLAQIIRLVSEAAASKAPIARIADKISAIFVPSAIVITIITVIGWLLAGREFAFAMGRGISVLVISCPCALGLATPVAIMVGSGVGAKNGILFKTAASLENMGQVKVAALDKTGTITAGQAQVSTVLTADNVVEDELLDCAAALERCSHHPLGIAIQAYTRERQNLAECSDFEEHPGRGVSAKCQDEELRGGTAEFIAEKAKVNESWRDKVSTFAQRGETPLWFCRGKRLLGLITVADPLKRDTVQALEELHNLGVRSVMVTGDHFLTADYIASLANVDYVRARSLPADKEATVRALQRLGKVAMVGDGINDAPALTRADLGVAIGAGTDIAIDAADVVLTKSSLRDVAAAIRLSRGVLRNIKQNLFWALFYNVLGIPLACGLFIPWMGWELSPTYSAAAMSLSSLCVVTNALRLNLLNIYDNGRDKKRAKSISIAQLNEVLSHKELVSIEESVSTKESISAKESISTMESISASNQSASGRQITISITGMMCPHCEATVKKTLAKFAGVGVESVSHKTGQAVIRVSGDIDIEAIKDGIADHDFQVTAISE